MLVCSLVLSVVCAANESQLILSLHPSLIPLPSQARGFVYGRDSAPTDLCGEILAMAHSERHAFTVTCRDDTHHDGSCPVGCHGPVSGRILSRPLATPLSLFGGFDTFHFPLPVSGHLHSMSGRDEGRPGHSGRLSGCGVGAGSFRWRPSRSR